ncbi:hypothetical protein BN890_49930 [Bacteroides xylanisolvens SD CC 1b]|uniref:Uncharacterized protein n=1 Tax=Bacteroides xylanisolvens SD CC 1b TaxID=702447 RepID=W6PCB8_9BACE|nr:hypothetical protein BN891_19780 [Bacteroides xylanisolvens SD CC 2a]CDM07369.1 hypothetical protein BN890_49930 [Bacteroides xylanisolvens SD CC 1b]
MLHHYELTFISPEKDLVLLQIPCYLFMFNYLIHGYSGVL